MKLRIVCNTPTKDIVIPHAQVTVRDLSRVLMVTIQTDDYQDVSDWLEEQDAIRFFEVVK